MGFTGALKAILFTVFGLYFSVIVHEFGHYLGCRLAGLKVALCGIGLGKPTIRYKRRETVFFISFRNLVGGVTLPVLESPDVKPLDFVLSVAGGMSLNLFWGMILLFVEPFWPLNANLWLALILTNAFVFLFSIIPFRFMIEGGGLVSDGGLLLGFLRGRESELPTPTLLKTVRLIRELTKPLNSRLSRFYLTLSAVHLYNELGLYQRAENVIDLIPCEWLEENPQLVPFYTLAEADMFLGLEDSGAARSAIENLKKMEPLYGFPERIALFSAQLAILEGKREIALRETLNAENLLSGKEGTRRWKRIVLMRACLDSFNAPRNAQFRIAARRNPVDEIDCRFFARSTIWEHARGRVDIARRDLDSAKASAKKILNLLDEENRNAWIESASRDFQHVVPPESLPAFLQE